MDIILYLTELLETRKSVGIAGLGTLYKKKSPGKYDASRHVFVPPSYELLFNSEVKDEYELVHYISARRNISTESANYYVGEFVENIQAQLAEQQKASLGNLGELTAVNDEMKLVSAGNGNLRDDFFGLPELPEINANPSVPDQLEAIAEENKVEEENPGHESFEKEFIADEQPVYEEISEVKFESPAEDNYWEQPAPAAIGHQQEVLNTPVATETQADDSGLTAHQPVSQTGEPENEIVNDPLPEQSNLAISSATAAEPVTEKKIAPPFDEKEWAKNIAHPNYASRGYAPDDEDDDDDRRPGRARSIFIKTLVILFFIAIAAALLYFFFPHFFDQYIRNHEEQPAERIQNVGVDSLKLKADSIRIDSLSKRNAVKTGADSNTIDTMKVYYEVIGSTENNELDAERYIARVAKKGIIAKPFRLTSRKVSVSLGTFNNDRKALKYRDSVSKVLKNQGIYVQPIKPKKHTK